ncbi:Asp-tRNA(Asn)/Glu-tRNA(Gln) amidotransferase subunit GatC [Bryobacter aggregatus]|uniref:Asp-tRNA(Asn)/Glu-tRNA(Gln) amidotransferase subunit GatC n=1 Tax=Bryobacter aggregatus TaxID=360054 RepID=UPI0004E1DEEC|nr:Asp-tRNA(Asn)/Glu-tRNA(Gln) amidotransferase subunit GatC [Bryobacter aggregatus]
MEFSKDDVRKIAKLANLELNDDEVSRMAHDMAEVLTHMEQLAGLDTSNVEPMAQVLFEASPTASLRADVVRDRTILGTADALRNSALSGAGHFKVPRVIER